jgi:iron complex transport system ATP-binding protein
MHTEKKITLQQASLGYRKSGKSITILENLDLDFCAGDFTGIVGLNGTGKSTLLKTLCGLLPPLKGNIYLEGENMRNVPLSALATKVSVVLTEKLGGFNLKTGDVVAAGRIPYTNAFNHLRPEDNALIDAAMEQCGIKDHREKPVHELSDGLFQKTVIAKSLAQQTPVMLLDEPSAFLDYRSKHELFLLLQKLAVEERKCILLSSHDLDLILKYCHKVLIVSSGQARLTGVSEARADEAFVRIAGGYL